MGDLSPHFSKHEFRCRCCGAVSVSPALVDILEDIRAYAGVPLVITSGFRCPEHNAAVGGSANSAHLTGEAADIFVSGNLDRFKILEGVFMSMVTRTGIAESFIHVDVKANAPQEVCWLYGGKD